MTNRFRLAVVGCGGIANYVSKLAKTIPGFQISACLSKVREESEVFAQQHNVPIIFDDFNQLLSQTNRFDAIYISTPHNLHASMIQQAVEANIPVLCEKPITEKFSTAQEIVQFVSQHSVKVGINYQYRYNLACKNLINYTHHDIGKLYYIKINIPWHRESNYFEGSTWHKSLSAAGGGTLLTQGSHFLDIALLAAKSSPIEAFGATDNKVFIKDNIEIEDFAHGFITLENGAHIIITSSMDAYPQQSATIDVYGEKGFCQFSATKRPHFTTKGMKPTKMRVHRPFGVHYLARSLQGFKNWIQNDIPYLTPIKSALPVMSVIDAIYRSANTGKVEEIN